MALVVLVPHKAPTEAKERLSGILSPGQRAELAAATFQTVVAAVRAAGLPLIVLAGEGTISRSLPADVEVLAESPAARGLNAQLEFAIGHETMRRYSRMLILHSDLPLATPAAIASTAGTAGEASRGVVMVESGDGGTNAMVLPLPPKFALAYGRDSFRRHRIAAIEAGLPVTAHANRALTLDLDTPDDVTRLLSSEMGRASPAGRLLMSWGIHGAASLRLPGAT